MEAEPCPCCLCCSCGGGVLEEEPKNLKMDEILLVLELDAKLGLAGGRWRVEEDEESYERGCSEKDLREEVGIAASSSGIEETEEQDREVESMGGR
jgi:hypothetical protein